MNETLIIFDCDGVLVDSEPISIGLMCDVCERMGFPMSEQDAYKAFLGKPVRDAHVHIKNLFNKDVEPFDLAAFQAEILKKFEAELKPVNGIAQALKNLPYAKCVASSSNLERIRKSLQLTGIDGFLEPNLFSTDMVERGKPHPDVFLHAAETMGFMPQNCIVIEDSPAGLKAAKAANMANIGFTGGSHGAIAALDEKLAPYNPDLIISNMDKLPHAIAQLIAQRSEHIQ